MVNISWETFWLFQRNFASNCKIENETCQKMNDLVVSDRQKHNGMSWSVSGSVALASLTALARNNEYALWFEEGNVEFKLAA